MSQVIEEIGYGYNNDEQKNYGKFGINEKVRLVSFAYAAKTGKEQTGGEALEMKFLFPGETEPQTHLVYPVDTITYTDKETREQTELKSFADCKNDDMKKFWNGKKSELSGVFTHVLHLFHPDEKVKATFARPITSFKQYVELASTLLPKDYSKIELDVFMQYRWNSTKEKDAEGNETGKESVFLEIPRTKRQGFFVVKHIEPVGAWKLVKMDPENTEDAVKDALKFVDEAGNIHPFMRSGFFIKSMWGKSKKERDGDFSGGSTLERAADQASGGITNDVVEGNPEGTAINTEGEQAAEW